MKAVADQGVPVPRMVCLCEDDRCVHLAAHLVVYTSIDLFSVNIHWQFCVCWKDVCLKCCYNLCVEWD